MSTKSVLLNAGEASRPRGDVSRDGDGRLVVRNKPIFRAGTFRDSKGRKRTYTRDDLTKMAKDFKRVREVISNVPVRAGHTRGDVDGVIGYFDDVRVDGDLLVGDYTITDAKGAEKIENTTWRNVSLEVGSYVNNDDQVVSTNAPLGLAYVDLSAVEGLYSLQMEDDTMEYTQEDLDKAVEDALKGVEDRVEYALGMGYAQGEADVKAEQASDTFEFTLADGSKTEDYAAVQAEIGRMGAEIAQFESAAVEAKLVARDSFIDDLVTDGKLTAPMAESMKPAARTMDDDGFAQFQKSFEVSPGLATGPQGTGKPADIDPGAQFAAELAELEAQFQMTQNAQLDLADYENSSWFKRLTQLRTQAQEV